METDNFNISSSPQCVVNPKRPRSPDNLPSERASKRLLTGLRDGGRAGVFSGLPSINANVRHSTPEDWVQQTRGLSIASPVFPGAVVGSAGDVDMNIDSDLPTLAARMGPSITLPAHAYGAGIGQGAMVVSDTPARQLFEFTATPTQPMHSQAMTAAGAAEPHRPPETSVMDFEPGMITPAFTQPPPNPRRPPRIAMGPRSGCKLCEDRVEGHFMHLV